MRVADNYPRSLRDKRQDDQQKGSNEPDVCFSAVFDGWLKTGKSLFVCVHIPEFPAQALLRLRPNLHGSPVAVFEDSAPQERVCAMNMRARCEGVELGMTRAEAKSFPGVTLLRRCVGVEAAARSVLLACAGRFSPDVEIFPRETTAVCVLDIAATALPYRSPQSFARVLRKALIARGLQGSIAISANYEAAVALARGVPGISFAAPGDEQRVLAPLLLQVLNLSEEQSQMLSLWGIRTLGGVATLPQKQLIASMGQSGKRLRELARGEHPHLFAPVPIVRVLREEFVFDAPVRGIEGILAVLSPMLDQLLLQARDQTWVIASVTLTLRLGLQALDTKHDYDVEESRLGDEEPVAPSQRNCCVIHLVARKEPDAVVKHDAEFGGDVPSLSLEVMADADSVSAQIDTISQRTIRPARPSRNKRLLLRLLQLELADQPPAGSVVSVVLEAQAVGVGS